MTDKDRWQHYVKGPLWTLWEAAYLLTGTLPKRQDEFDQEDLMAFDPLALTYRALKDAITAGTLEQVGRSNDKKNKRVRPAGVVQWAMAHGIDVPSELDALKQAAVVPAAATGESLADRNDRWLAHYDTEAKTAIRGAYNRTAAHFGVESSTLRKAVQLAATKRATRIRAGTKEVKGKQSPFPTASTTIVRDGKKISR